MAKSTLPWRFCTIVDMNTDKQYDATVEFADNSNRPKDVWHNGRWMPYEEFQASFKKLNLEMRDYRSIL